jgi:hypothetical protein
MGKSGKERQKREQGLDAFAGGHDVLGLAEAHRVAEQQQVINYIFTLYFIVYDFCMCGGMADLMISPGCAPPTRGALRAILV